jgi:hypothetical protein
METGRLFSRDFQWPSVEFVTCLSALCASLIKKLLVAFNFLLHDHRISIVIMPFIITHCPVLFV